MRLLFGSSDWSGMICSGSNLLDLLLAGSSVTIGGKVPGVLARVVLRCVLGFWARTRGFVGLVLVVIGTGCTCSHSVVDLSPSVVDNWPPATIVLMARLISFIAFLFDLFFKRCKLLSHSTAAVLLCCCSDSVGSWQCC